MTKLLSQISIAMFLAASCFFVVGCSEPTTTPAETTTEAPADGEGSDAKADDAAGSDAKADEAAGSDAKKDGSDKH